MTRGQPTRRRVLVLGAFLASSLTAAALQVLPERAEASTTPCAKVAGHRNGVLIVGDSLTVYSAAQLRKTLTAEGARVCLDAVGGRTAADGVRTLRQYARAGRLPPTVVMALGTNDFRTPRASFRDSVADTLRIAGKRDVLWVSGYRTVDAQAITALRRLDRDLAEADAASRRLHWANWAARAQGHAGYYQKDGVHLTKAGNNARVGLIAKSLRLMRQ